MRLNSFLLMTFCLITVNLYAQNPTISLLDTSRKVSIRGLSVVNDNVVWCSGSNGSVAKSIDGGKTFTWQTVTGYEKRDFRDIEAFDASTAVIIAVAEPAIILKTKDGGQTWKKVFEDTTKGMFLDAMDFNDTKNGFVIGDPINGKAFLASTIDGGENWEPIKELKNKGGLSQDILLGQGEAFFASSGTNIKIFKKQEGATVLLGVTGGKLSNFFLYGCCISNLPIIQGKESTGANSIDIYNGKNAVIVGGDFTNDKDTTNNCVLLKMYDGTTFSKPQTPPHGYRSCVVYINEKTLVACGTSGVDISYDGGNNWQLISTQSFHVVQKAKDGNAIYLAGSRGKIARLSF